MRAFIAIELPPVVAAALADIQQRLKRTGLKARWVRPENVHLTLKFLGEIDAQMADAISSAIKAVGAGFAPFTLAAAGLGVFPRRRQPRVLWAGLSDGAPDVVQLQQALEAPLAACGFAPEKRPFRGHLTLARFRDRVDPEKLQVVLRDFGRIRIGQWAVSDLVLFQSELRPGGPRYTQLVSHPLAV